MKPKLLVVELWGLGDLIIATPFLQAAAEKYDVTLLAKPFAQDLRARFWPQLNAVPYLAPWTAFKGKYRLWRWPWRQMLRLWRQLAREGFAIALSARWDPRDHILLRLSGAKTRLGFPRLRSRHLLTHPLGRPDPGAHRYEYWRVLGQTLGLRLPAREQLVVPHARANGGILVHSGARLPVRVWPLERYLHLVQRLRGSGHKVRVACDPNQLHWWKNVGETDVACPHTVEELFAATDGTGLFVGNDSGPGHLAAFCGVPTFTVFGPQLPEWFAPLHPAAEWVEGKACPYKPCSDYCRFSVPHCIVRLSEEDVWGRVQAFLQKNARQADQPQAGVRAA